MKLPVLFLAVSLAGNVSLVALFVNRPALAPPAFRDLFTNQAKRAAQAAEQSHALRASEAARAKAAATRAAAERAKIWPALASDDLATLVARLRAAGFSAVAIRGVVNTRLDAWFRTRMKELAGDPADTPFWKPDGPGFMSNAKLFEAQSQVYRERAAKLRTLLGDDFFATGYGNATATQRAQFGDIPRAKIDLVQRIADDYAEMTQQVTAAARGMMLPEDHAKLALLEREKRADLAAVLSPAELEDYLMRSSPITSRLRSAMSFMDASEAEFRAIYQIQLPYANVLYPTSSGGITYFSSDLSRQRTEAQTKIAEQAKAALGDARYAEFARASSSEFQQLTRLAQRENLPAAAAVRAYDARDAAARESMRIIEDRTLNTDQKRAALQFLAQTTTTQIVGALGANAGNAYAKSASWLTRIANGSAVSFGPDGLSMRTHSLPPPGFVPPAAAPQTATPPPAAPRP